jgi:hypothetical protein
MSGGWLRLGETSPRHACVRHFFLVYPTPCFTAINGVGMLHNGTMVLRDIQIRQRRKGKYLSRCVLCTVTNMEVYHLRSIRCTAIR